MAGNRGFSVTIVAEDKATATLKSVNKSLATLPAAAERFGKAAAKIASTTGLDNVAAGFGAILQTAQGAASAIASISPALAGIAGVTSVAGVTALASRFGDVGTQIQYASRRAGAGVAQFDALAGASRLAGGSAEGAAAGLSSFRDMLTDSVGGQASAGLLYLRQFNVQFQGTGLTAKNVMQVLPQALRALNQIADPSLQARVAGAWFGGAADDFIRLSKLGAGGYDALIERMKSYGLWSDEATASARRLNEAESGVGFAVRGLGITMATALEPEFTPILRGMDDWIRKNREWIATRTGDEVRGLTEDLKSATPYLGAFATAADSAAQALGGWHRVIEGLLLLGGASAAMKLSAFIFRPLLALGSVLGPGAAALPALGFVGAAGGEDTEFSAAKNAEYLRNHPSTDPPGAPRTGWQRLGAAVDRGWHAIVGGQSGDQKDAAARRIYAYAIARGLSPAAAGIVANFDAESGLDPRNVGDGGAAYGLGQWRDERRTRFAALYGHPLEQATEEEQVDYFIREGRGMDSQFSGSGALDAKTPQEAGGLISLYGERPAAGQMAARYRAGLAAQWALRLAGGAPAYVPTGGTPGEVLQRLRVSIDVNTTGNPGTTTRVTADAPAGVDVDTPRVVRALPDTARRDY